MEGNFKLLFGIMLCVLHLTNSEGLVCFQAKKGFRRLEG